MKRRSFFALLFGVLCFWKKPVHAQIFVCHIFPEGSDLSFRRAKPWITVAEYGEMLEEKFRTNTLECRNIWNEPEEYRVEFERVNLKWALIHGEEIRKRMGIPDEQRAHALALLTEMNKTDLL